MPSSQSLPARAKPFSSEDPFIELWQKIIALVIEVADAFDGKWQKRRRLIDTRLLILFRIMNVPLPQPKPVAPSAFCHARAKLDETIFKTLNANIIRTHEPSLTEDRWKHHRAFAVDGTQMNLPPPLRADGYRTPSENAHYPQGLVSCVYRLKAKIPYDFDLVSQGDERIMALSHLKTLRRDDLVVYDRSYFSYALFHAHIKQGIHAVFRLIKNAYKAIDEFMFKRGNSPCRLG